jgi:hypothetical protein
MTKPVSNTTLCARTLEAAARAVEGMRPCPFDKNGEVARGALVIEPHQPCPVCGDRGDDLDAPVNCRSPAAIIRALACHSEPVQ